MKHLKFILVNAIWALILIAIIVLNQSGMFTNKSSMDNTLAKEYAAKYSSLLSSSQSIQDAAYSNALAAGTSPTEIKYLFEQIAPNISQEKRETMLAQYINHIEYFSNTYTNVASVYSSILTSLSNYDFTKRESAYEVSDQVLRSLLLEIYDADMYMAFENNIPYIFINYDLLKTEFSSYAGASTLNYLDICEYTQNANVGNADGSYNIETLSNIMSRTNDFIKTYPSYALIDSVIYRYVVALEMYTGIYNIESDKVYTNEEMLRLSKLRDNASSDTVAASVADTILNAINEDQTLKVDAAQTLLANIDSLVRTESEN